MLVLGTIFNRLQVVCCVTVVRVGARAGEVGKEGEVRGGKWGDSLAFSYITFYSPSFIRTEAGHK